MEYLIFTVVYFLSAILWWKYVNLAHSKGGRYEGSSVSFDYLICMFFPFLNTFLCFIGYFFVFPIKGKVFDCCKFFKINK